jgi:hypothetical protein
MSETRSAVLHCPYCAEEDLRPTEDSHGSWLCASCRRVFAVRLIGIAPLDISRDGEGRLPTSAGPVSPAGSLP